MGKHKKKFIDKKNSVTFHLVHRSQHDPLVTDETAPQHVLVEAKTKQSTDIPTDKRKKEQQKFGIFYDDDYDYLQHLREPTTKEVVWEYVETPNQHKSKKEQRETKIQLPSSVFATEFEEDEGMLNKAAPCPGPKPDWDPDVVAALDDDFDFDDPNNQMEDDFVIKAMEGQQDNDEEDESNSEGFNENDEDEYEDDVDSDGPMYDEDDDYDCDKELVKNFGSLFRKNNFDEVETKSRFTEYSLTSSVIRRNEQLQLLDERFEEFFKQYNDPEIGALDMEDIEGNIEQKHPLLMQCYRLYKKESDCDKYNKKWDKERLKVYTEEYSPDTDGKEDEELVEMPVEDEKQKKWDCESILSTYSNIYNHPKLIEEPQKQRKKEKIQINPKTGIPMNVLKGGNKLTLNTLTLLNMQNDNDNDEEKLKCGPKSLCSQSVISILSIRPKDETHEEKKERKKLLKEYRSERRIERKANAEAFKEEKKRQSKIKINNQNIQGKRIL